MNRTLYDGMWELKLSKNHQYSVRRVGTNKWIRVPGVTSVLNILGKPSLTYWAANEAASYFIENVPVGEPLTQEQILAIAEEAKRAHTKSSSRAKNIGSLVHDWIEQFWIRKKLGKEPPPLPENEDARNAVEGFLGWVDEHEVQVVEVEIPLLGLDSNGQPQYAGKTDLVAYIDGQPTLVDYKTSKGLYLEYALQIAAYWWAYVQEKRTYIKNVQLVRIDKETGVFEEGRSIDVNEEEFNTYLQTWQSVLSTYNNLNAAKKFFAAW